MFLVSACLLGENCKYNGGNNYHQQVVEFCKTHSVFSVCPEGVSGLPTPRPPAEYCGNRILDRQGKDVTEYFRQGAILTWEMAEEEARKRGENIEGAILKANSPSCGKGSIYDGTFTKTLIEGHGCFVRMLLQKGIHIVSEKEIENGKL